ncbi:MAG: DinB family protein [Trebonia sp.]
MDDEIQALLTSLNAQREHVLGALDGLSEDELRRPLLRSGWTPLGMVQHLALEVEQFWFRGAVAGEPLTLTSGDEAWQVPADVPVAAILGLYRDEITRANAIIAATPIDAMPKWWPDFFADFPPRPLRRTILHVIAETATHAGHLDVFRELTNGTQWLVLTE